MLTHNELVLTFEGCYLAATFVKIDQEMHACDCDSANRQTHAQTGKLNL